MTLSRSLLLIAIMIWLIPAAFAQKDSTSITVTPAFYAYVYTHEKLSVKNDNPLLIGTVPFEKDKFYAELRYNYDQSNTFGFYAGKIFIIDKEKQEHKLIPQLGLLAGDYNAVSFQLYYQYLREEKVEINFQQQYSLPFNDLPAFYYNWSDISFPFKKGSKYSFGASMQIYADRQLKTIDGGLYLGRELGDWGIELYSFNFYKPATHYIVFGLTREFSSTRVKRKRL